MAMPPARAENLVHGSDQQSCPFGALPVLLTGHVPAFVFLLIVRVAGGLRLSRREEMWKTAEILILRLWGSITGSGLGGLPPAPPARRPATAAAAPPAAEPGGRRVGAGNYVTSCVLRIFVDQAAEPIPPQNTHLWTLTSKRTESDS
jgi:hypothetical protein